MTKRLPYEKMRAYMTRPCGQLELPLAWVSRDRLTIPQNHTAREADAHRAGRVVPRECAPHDGDGLPALNHTARVPAEPTCTRTGHGRPQPLGCEPRGDGLPDPNTYCAPGAADARSPARTGQAAMICAPERDGLPAYLPNPPQTPVQWAAYWLAQAMVDAEIVDYLDCIARSVR